MMSNKMGYSKFKWVFKRSWGLARNNKLYKFYEKYIFRKLKLNGFINKKKHEQKMINNFKNRKWKFFKNEKFWNQEFSKTQKNKR